MTREEIIRKILGDCNIEFYELKGSNPELLPVLDNYIKEYAQYEVERALQAAADKAEIIQFLPKSHHKPFIPKESITKAYKVE